MITRKTVAALSVAALAATTVALPAAAANGNEPVQVAACGATKASCNPCAAKKAANPCAAKANPCAAKGNPCSAKAANPCSAKK